MHQEIERMALEAVQRRLKSTRLPSRIIYPPPAAHFGSVQRPGPKVPPWLLTPAPLGQLTQPPPPSPSPSPPPPPPPTPLPSPSPSPPPPPPPSFRYRRPCDERRRNRGEYPKMEP
ncbi:hypothetical protein CCACVL1_17973 [Corchorus capsularis]|uniref:Uncharacterized protein n=1 Tax=Corchorus capsularis TaxID=210143 RepID=A0A1R3HP35_COCAP|nr:hypothetical protein CCACVL1_17973 [Corchorus capsularis]